MAEIDNIRISNLRGLGESRAKSLEKELEGDSLRDLLFYFPSRYVDRSRFYKISELNDSLPYVQVLGCFVNFAVEGEGARRRLIGAFSDGRSLMEVVWFSKISTIRNMYKLNKPYVIFGRPTYFNHSYSMSHPEVEEYSPDRPFSGLQGIYPISEAMRKKGITQRVLRTAESNITKLSAFNSMPETIPEEILSAMNLMPLKTSIAQLHSPSDPDSLACASYRMKFEELFYLELNILRYARRRSVAVAGHFLPRVGEKFNTFYSRILPFSLTGAQQRVLREIRDDMRSGHQMNRLLQGDVGSGKTMVAFMTMLLAADNGFQTALMAPTEILATQHYESILPWCEALGLQCRLLTGSTRTAARREISEGLLSGEIQILVGTHALLEEKVAFSRLGVAVIDEQHRFGVAQRAKLWKKNSIPPHVLVMTATPIPRTLAMTVYGDLDVSVIDELPPGRKPIETLLCFDNQRMEINRVIASQLKAGRQAYIVYPLIHENTKLDYKSVEQGYERIRGIFKDVEVSCVHGEMSPQKKDAEMQKFAEGKSRILVATTVIEVGVNVPNATVMVIENAERFGLSQLHQLRGRVGRGGDKSFCLLVAKPSMGASTKKRLNIMTETTDGFLISEADMKLRGPGDMEGTQQSGLAFNLKVSNLAKDGQIVKVARDVAIQVVDAHKEFFGVTDDNESGQRLMPFLSSESLAMIDGELRRRFDKTVDWSQIS